MHRATPWLLAGGTGAWLGAVGPGPWGPAALLATGAVLARTCTGRLPTDLALGLLHGLVLHAVALAWVPGVLAMYGVPDAGLAGAGLVILQALGTALCWPVAGLARRWAVPAAPAVALGVLATVPLRDALQPLVASPALWLTGWPGLLAPAVLGEPALSALALATGALPWRALAPTALAWCLLAARPSLAPDTGRLTIGLVQPGVDAFDGRRPSQDAARRERVRALVDAAVASGAELVLTPEAAWPDDPGPPGSARRAALAEAFADVPVPVLLGVGFSEPPTTSLVLLRAGEIVAQADKQVRVPLVEAPMAGWPAADGIVAGTNRLLPFGDDTIAALICVEDTSSAARHAASAADLIVLTANDAWTDHTPGTSWHVAWARLAAATLPAPVVRVSNTGPSGLFPHFDALPPGAEGVAVVSVTPGGRRPPPPPPWLLAAASISGLWLARRRHLREDTRPPAPRVP